MIYWIDIDAKGTASIRDLIEAGVVTRLPGANTESFNKSALHAVKSMKPGDTVILDTVTTGLDTIRMDMKLGDELREDLFEVAKAKYLGGDAQYLNVYQAAQSTFMRRFNNLVRRATDVGDITVIAIAHEDEGVDPMTGMKKLGPDVNPAMLPILIGHSSDMYRLRVLHEDVVSKASGDVVAKAGARVLYLRDTDEYMAKYNVPLGQSEGIPRYLLNPTMPDVIKTLGARPLALVLYGPPGAGKTTLAVSEARKQTNKKEK